jgi:hypothetical protein
MPSTGPRAKNWCFTLNNYTPEDVDRLLQPIAGVEYLIFGREVSSTGTPHLQGFVCFRSRKRLSQTLAVVGVAHCTVTRSVEKSIEYCKKDDDFSEVGIPPQPSPQGTKKGNSEIEEFKQSVKEGVTDVAELRELHSGVCAQFPKFVVQYLDDLRPKHAVAAHPLRLWQQELYGVLILPPDERLIEFVVDRTGNQGKSWFARYYTDMHDNAQIVIPGKKADMALTIREEAKVFFFDCPRSKQGEYIQYDFLEELKNGLIFSPKYESKIKKLATPHVVVLMNEHPDETKLSGDRYSVRVLRG